jgi:hypothetical protein
LSEARLIDSTYIRLNKAAEMLESDSDTVLIAATEDRIRLYFLLNRIVSAERGTYDEIKTASADEPTYVWVPSEYGYRHFMYIPFPGTEAAELLRCESVEANANMLSEAELDGSYWVPVAHWATAGGGLSQDDLRVTREAVFVKRRDVENIRNRGMTPAAGEVAPPNHGTIKAHLSDRLAKMNQASFKFWSNADRSDRSTHPDNATVAAWFLSQGFTSTLAEKAATLIRPEWVPTGRKPEE